MWVLQIDIPISVHIIIKFSNYTTVLTVLEFSNKHHCKPARVELYRFLSIDRRWIIDSTLMVLTFLAIVVDDQRQKSMEHSFQKMKNAYMQSKIPVRRKFFLDAKTIEKNNTLKKDTNSGTLYSGEN